MILLAHTSSVADEGLQINTRRRLSVSVLMAVPVNGPVIRQRRKFGQPRRADNSRVEPTGQTSLRRTLRVLAIKYA